MKQNSLDDGEAFSNALLKKLSLECLSDAGVNSSPDVRKGSKRVLPKSSADEQQNSGKFKMSSKGRDQEKCKVRVSDLDELDPFEWLSRQSVPQILKENKDTVFQINQLL